MSEVETKSVQAPRRVGSIVNRNAAPSAEAEEEQSVRSASAPVVQPPGVVQAQLDSEWKEPELPEGGEKEPSTEMEERPIQYQELLGKTFLRKDMAESPKRYEVIGLWPQFRGAADDRSNPEALDWRLQVWVFRWGQRVLTDREGNKKRERMSYGNAKVPGTFTIEARTFERLFRLE